MPTLERLNALPERENDEKAEDEHIEKFVRHWARLAKAWRSYLETEESPDTAPEIPSDGGHRSAKWWKTAGCHWNQCLCRYTPTHTMRVCKGCSEVAYCGTACQTRDWSDGGHRDVCAGGNTSD
ncbi:hypothetical protein BDW22DRAFT_714916 [Trametopsis cervina]|nr:hypothetical protein BDW22DRAFT_714916 [Trametopsis cervina]